MKLEVFFQLERFVKGLSADFTDGADLARVLPHVVQEVLLLAEDVAANVATVLDSSRMNRDVFLEAVEAGEFAATNTAHEEAAIVLNGRGGVTHFRDGI